MKQLQLMLLLENESIAQNIKSISLIATMCCIQTNTKYKTCKTTITRGSHGKFANHIIKWNKTLSISDIENFTELDFFYDCDFLHIQFDDEENNILEMPVISQFLFNSISDLVFKKFMDDNWIIKCKVNPTISVHVKLYEYSLDIQIKQMPNDDISTIHCAFNFGIIQKDKQEIKNEKNVIKFNKSRQNNIRIGYLPLINICQLKKYLFILK